MGGFLWEYRRLLLHKEAGKREKINKKLADLECRQRMNWRQRCVTACLQAAEQGRDDWQGTSRQTFPADQQQHTEMSMRSALLTPQLFKTENNTTENTQTNHSFSPTRKWEKKTQEKGKKAKESRRTDRGSTVELHGSDVRPQQLRA